VKATANGVPFVIEVACGWDTKAFERYEQQSIVGVNWSPVLKPPFPQLASLLDQACITAADAVVVLVHLAMPRPDFTDQGKSVLALPPAVGVALAKGITAVTRHWTTLKRQADKDDRVRERERDP
jgi:hypothetical protein